MDTPSRKEQLRIAKRRQRAALKDSKKQIAIHLSNEAYAKLKELSGGSSTYAEVFENLLLNQENECSGGVRDGNTDCKNQSTSLKELLCDHEGEITLDITREDLMPFLTDSEFGSLCLLVYSDEPIFEGLSRHIIEEWHNYHRQFFNYLDMFFHNIYFESLMYIAKRFPGIIQFDEEALLSLLKTEADTFINILDKKWASWAALPLE